jgi:transcriptional regulator with XRE-family HTH domain
VIAVERWTGRETRALRRALRMTVIGFAEHLGVAVRTVSNWEARGTDIEPLPEMQAALDTALSRASTESVHRFQAFLAQGEQAEFDPLPVPEGRRPAVRPSLQVSAQVIDELTRLRMSLVRSDSLLGPGRLIATVAEQVANVQDMLDSARGDLRRRVFDLAALYAEFQGWLFEDVGQSVRSVGWTGRSVEWAQASDNADLAAYTLMRRAQQAAGQQDSALTIGLAQAAGRQPGVSARIQSASAQQHAAGLALEGEQLLALRAMDEAEALIDQEEDLTADPYSLAEWCTPSYVLAQRANVLITLGQGIEAVQTFDQALAIWPEEYRRERGLHLSRKARALAMDRQLDQAVAVGTEALGIAVDTGSRRTLAELQTMADLAAEQDIANRDVGEFSAALLSAVHGGTAS